MPLQQCHICNAPDAEPVVRDRSRTHPLCIDCRAELDLFGRMGKALCGELWQSALGTVLTKNERTVRSLWHGDRKIPAEVWPALEKALSERADELPDLLNEVRDKTADKEAAA